MVMHFPNPGPMLAGVIDNGPRPGGGGNWTERIAGGRYLVGPNPRHQWISVRDPGNEFDTPLTGISGTIVTGPHVSGADNPFLHPFRNDYEFHVAPDPAYFDLVGPRMVDAYRDATERARTRYDLAVPGVIGMEMDAGLVPAEYRPDEGDRICLWGRLIVDAGHTDFHTEIHPPLIMVSAQPGRSAQQQGPRPPAFDATIVKITTRPFLVSQEFDHGGLFNHLAVQLTETIANPLPTGRIDAHPRLMPMPFQGMNIATFDIQPPSPRVNVHDVLVVESTITQRSSRGISISVMQNPDLPDSIRVLIILNDADYVAPPVPARHDRDVSVAELAGDDVTAPLVVGGGILGAGAVSHIPQLAIVIARGLPTHRYEEPRAESPGHENSATRIDVADLHAEIPTNKDDRQAFPLFGTIKLEWRRFAGHIDDAIVRP